MICFDTSKLKNIVYHNCGQYEETTTFVNFREKFNSSDLDLYMYSGCMLDEPPYGALAYIRTTLHEKYLEIIDIISTNKNMGNGKQLFFNLLQCIEIINKEQKINKITGELSNVDFDHWNKLLHFYSNMNYYILKYNVGLNYSIEFNLDKGLSVDELINSMHLFKNKTIGFYYNIIPNSQ